MTLVPETADHKPIPIERVLPDRSSRLLALAEPLDIDSYALTTLRLVGTPARLAEQPVPTQANAAELKQEWGLDQLDLAQVGDGVDAGRSYSLQGRDSLADVA
jgi:hypothetical protein